LNLLVIFVLAVVMTALLLPGYRSYTLSEHGKLAMAALQDILRYQHSWRPSESTQVPASLEGLGYSAPAIYVSSDGTVRTSATINSIYRISLSVPVVPSPENCGLVPDDGQAGFVLVAQPVQTQRIETDCGRLCLSSSGKRGTTGKAPLSECWGDR
jgi:Tfp pilus assembly protein PilE